MARKPSSHSPDKPRSYSWARASSAARGYGGRWRKIRDAVLRREPLCRSCRLLGLDVEATDVDHIVPRARGGTDEASNLQPLCHSCHSKKTATEDVERDQLGKVVGPNVIANEGCTCSGTAKGIPHRKLSGLGSETAASAVHEYARVSGPGPPQMRGGVDG